MFHKMPLILIGMIVVLIIFDPFISFEIKQILYSISLSIKAIIILLLPLVILSLLFKSAVLLSSHAVKVIGLTLVLVCVSNFIATFLSRYIGLWTYHFDLSILSPEHSIQLTALWSLEMPKLIANDKAMLLGLILGIVASRVFPEKSLPIAHNISTILEKLLNGLIYVIPLFIAGFVVKLQYEGMVMAIVKDYIAVFMIIAVTQLTYIVTAYFALNKFKIKASLKHIKDMAPAVISGFSSMSSAASLPLLLMGSEKNAKNKEVIRSVLPAMINIHLIGDCFAIPILAYAILKSFGLAEPTLIEHLIFSVYFVCAKFSVAAVPGGGIIVMLPILANTLDFSSDMLSLMTALYIMFDPFITGTNVLGHGAFAQLIDNLITYLNKSPTRAC